MKFYCEIHGKDVFPAELPGRVMCDTGQHDLGKVFPSEEFWEYCCNCERVFCVGSASDYIPNTQCRRCPRPISVRYLCDQCGVFTLDSTTAARGRAYRVKAGHPPVKVIPGQQDQPACPGCSRPPQSVLNEHYCLHLGLLFTTPRNLCTFLCEAGFFPSSSAEYLNNIKDEHKTSVSLNILEVDDNLLIPSSDGEFVLVGNGSGRDQIVIPRMTSFFTKQDYSNSYQNYYLCSGPFNGEVQIIKPAIVEKTDAGWRLREVGRLEVSEVKRTLRSEEASKELVAPLTKHILPVVRPRKSAAPPSVPPKSETISKRSVVTKSQGLDITSTVDRDSKDNAIVSGKPSARIVVFTLLASIAVVSLFLVWKMWSPLSGTTTNVNSLPSPTPTRSAMPQAPPGMVYIRPGEFSMGRNDGTELERPAHTVSINKAVFIDLREVKCQEYESFLTANPKAPAPIGWKDRKCPAGKELWPVSGVDWYGADAYAKSKGRRLPTEEEWEYVARGGDKNLLYPWGNAWEENAANAGSTSPGHIVAVGSYPAGASVSGVLDMVGNIWEWTSSDITSYGGSLPQRLSNGEKVSLGKVIRGGAWNGDKTIATTTYRMGYPPRGAGDYSNTGFRCVMDAPSP